MGTEDKKERRVVPKAEKFVDKVQGKKEGGTSIGYTLKSRKERIYMIKPLPFERPSDESKMIFRGDSIREFVGGGIVRDMLGKKAAKIQVVTDKLEKKDNKQIEIASQFLQNVALLGPSTYTIAIVGDFVINNFEEIIAACQAISDRDYHGGNLMISKGPIVDGVQTYDLHKIDHGRALMLPFMGFKEELLQLVGSFNNFGYTQYASTHFDIDRYYKHIAHMHECLEKNSMNSFDNSIKHLKDNGIKFVDRGGIGGDINNGDNIHLYKAAIKNNIKQLGAFKLQLEIITKFDHMSKDFKKGKWLNDLSKYNDPITYALSRNITIEGQDPLVWLQRNHATEYAEYIKNNKETQHVRYPGEKYYIWAIENGHDISPSYYLKHFPEDLFIAAALSNNKGLHDKIGEWAGSKEYRQTVLLALIKAYQSEKDQANKDKIEKIYNNIIALVSKGTTVHENDAGILAKADARTIAIKMQGNLPPIPKLDPINDNEALRNRAQQAEQIFAKLIETQELKLTLKQIEIGNEFSNRGGAFEGLIYFINKALNYFKDINVKATASNVKEGLENLDKTLNRKVEIHNEDPSKASENKTTGKGLMKFAERIAMERARSKGIER